MEKVPVGFGAGPGQVQQGSGEGSEEGSRKPWCKAKSGSTGSGEGSGRLWCRARSGSTGEKVPEKVWEALVQSQIRFHRVPEKVPVQQAWLRSTLQKDLQK